VRLESVYQPTDRRKGRSAIQAEISPDVPPSRRVSLSPDDRAQRLAEIRLILADAAPTFRARIARIAELAPTALGESEARP
jgi:hypothetical protein